ncbi:MAG: peptide-methionine (S)-S-oxide reductase MsrA [Caulobacter sp.]|jgi:peptide-methionine (S)-S-oxide reductase|nr:peptide-methionine (S)-S-oxide reductase MsrA [Caulobacter sp.]
MKRLIAAVFAFASLAVLAFSQLGGAAQAQEARRETAYFAGGCFWCVEHDLAKVPGVIDVVSGYAGGTLRNPTYENHTGHIEAVKVVFDPSRISYRALTDRFFRKIDPTDAGGQFCDRGREYTTAIWARSDAQKRAAQAAKSAAQSTLGGRGRVVTPVLDFVSFWPAEGYHQDYAEKNPVRYNIYRTSCGRDARVRSIWGQ